MIDAKTACRLTKEALERRHRDELEAQLDRCDAAVKRAIKAGRFSVNLPINEGRISRALVTALEAQGFSYTPRRRKPYRSHISWGAPKEMKT